MGRKPKKLSELAASGSRRLRERLADVAPPPGPIDPPSWLEGRPLEIWASVLPMLEDMKVGTVADVQVIARYCHWLDLWLKAREQLDAASPIQQMNSKDGQPLSEAVSAEAKWLMETDKRLLVYERHLGLTPTARMGLRVYVQKNETPKTPAEDGKPCPFRIA